MEILLLNLFLSTLFLAVIYAPIRLSEDRGSGIAWAFLVLLVAIPTAMISSPVLFFQTILTAIALGIWTIRGESRKRFLAMSAGSVFVAYMLCFGIGLMDLRGFRDLRRLYPMESLELRLAGRKP